MPDKQIAIPGYDKLIVFPDSMTPEQMNAAAAKLYTEKNPTHPPVDKAHSWIDTAVDWLPSAVGTVGGLIGATGGPLTAVGGAMLGGATGEALKQKIQVMRGQQAEPTLPAVAKDIGLAALEQGGAEAVGGVVGKVASTLAPRLMQSALKPGVRAIAKDITAGLPVPKVVQTLLDEGINVTPGGVAKLQTILDATNEEIGAIVKAAPGTIDRRTVAAAVAPTAKQFANQVNPLADLTKIGNTVDNFLNHPTLGPGTGLSVAEAQKLKVGTYRLLKAKYGELGEAGIEAEKALARGLKDEIAHEVPAVSALNEREGRVLEALEATGRRAALNSNRDPIGFAWAAHNPSTFLAALIDRNPVAKSLIARGLYQGAGIAAKVSPLLIRVAVGSLSAGEPLDDAAATAAYVGGPAPASAATSAGQGHP